jgi:hypothetical protein
MSIEGGQERKKPKHNVLHSAIAGLAALGGVSGADAAQSHNREMVQNPYLTGSEQVTDNPDVQAIDDIFRMMGTQYENGAQVGTYDAVKRELKSADESVRSMAYFKVVSRVFQQIWRHPDQARTVLHRLQSLKNLPPVSRNLINQQFEEHPEWR